MSVNGDETIAGLGQQRKFFSEGRQVFREARGNFREGQTLNSFKNVI
jgi:hypothetical protein